MSLLTGGDNVSSVCKYLQENGRPRFTPGDLSAHLSPLFENLFLAFQKPESAENEYLMKCVMRVITFVGTDVRPSYPLCIAASTLQCPASWRLTLSIYAYSACHTFLSASAC